MIAPGQKLGPRRSTDGADEEPIERHALSRNRVDVRRADLRVAVLAVIAPACIIGEEDDDIRLCQRYGTGGKEE